MVVNPATLSLTLCSGLITGFTLYAAATGVRILQRWNLRSGSAQQLLLERKTYLVSTILHYAIAFELLTLLLFVTSTDRMHTLFVGAMCAAGTLNVNAYGYPTLIIKIGTFLLGGIWLVVNAVDHRAWDYPLIRFKYAFLLVLALLLTAELIVQTRFFLQMDPQIITSCCGTLFSDEMEGVARDLLFLPIPVAATLFAGVAALTVGAAVRFFLCRQGALLYALLATCFFGIALASVISFISVYHYELPTHHCPFCLLQKEYHYIGYVLYFSLFYSTISASSIGVLQCFKAKRSLAQLIPRLQRRLCLHSLAAFIAFVGVALYPVVFSNFTLR